MAFDFKKEYKELYTAKGKPVILQVPLMYYLAVRGKGDPNEEGGAYQHAVSVLYAIAYTIKMSYRGSHKIRGFFEYVVPPLEGFWWQDGVNGIDYGNKQLFNWISVIRLPDFVAEDDLQWAAAETARKKKMDCSAAQLLSLDEGLCVQMMHTGPFDDESATISVMDRYLNEKGYINDISDTRLHHEIYLSNTRKVEPSKWKTVIRHPIRKPHA
ncbi:MAG: transcriptional regulator [Firmicutes bacterium]|nr:transcriptional regulator [Bacillota bacterium]